MIAAVKNAAPRIRPGGSIGIPEPQREELFTTLAGRTLTEAIGDADQIAAAHLFLMENRFVTGTVLTVDGGFVLTGS